MQDVGGAGDQQQPRFEQDYQLALGNAVQEMELHVALPRFEDDFNAPSQAVESQDPVKVGAGLRDGRDEDRPVHQFQDGLGGVVSPGFLFRLHAPEVGRLLIDGRRQQPHGRMGGIVEQDLHVEPLLAPKQGGQIDGLEGLRVEINRPGLVPVNAIGVCGVRPAHLVGRQIAAVAQHQIPRLDG